MKELVKKIKRNRVFIMIIIIVGIITFFMYKTFTNKLPVSDNELYIKSSVELKSEDFDENKRVIIDALSKKKINILIRNNFNSKKKIFVWYKVEDDEKVKVGNLSSSIVKLSKDGLVIKEKDNIEIKIGIKNELEESTTVEFGIIYNDVDEELDNINNYVFIDEVFKIGNQRVLTIGDKIILKDNSVWHVIAESDSNDTYMTLLRDTVINIDRDEKSLNVKNNMVLHDVTDENMSFYLDNNYRKELEDKNIQIGEDGEIRLITLSELQEIGEYEYKDYNYYAKKVPDWLVIENPWWTMTPFSNDSHYYVNKKNIMAVKDDKNTRASIRVVVKILKSNIK